MMMMAVVVVMMMMMLIMIVGGVFCGSLELLMVGHLLLMVNGAEKLTVKEVVEYVGTMR
jgi:Co/Zn/Cd efflux system component